jgi:predicted nucleic acid-binding protein
MIVIDSSVFIAYFSGIKNGVTNKVEELLSANNVAMSPVVLVELLSDAALSDEFRCNLMLLPILEPKTGFWVRAGLARSKILARKLKARLADTLIAQTCIDYDCQLLTLDKDFQYFAKYCGLKLI